MDIFKQLRTTGLLVGLLCLSVGCEDFLEKEPLGNLSTEVFFETADDAALATNAVYHAYRAWFVTGGFPIADIMSDDMVKGSSPPDNAATLNTINSFEFTASEGTFSNIWAALFVGVRRANAVIKEVPNIEMDEALRNRLLAEAHFLRAAFYFDLARAYGDLPKVLTANPERQLPRSPVAEIYEEIIIPDLTLAAAELPLKSEYDDPSLGRATQGAAQGLLAKVYLYRENYSGAQELAEAVITSGEYTLPDNFAAEFSEAVQGPGSVFEISAVRDEFNNGGNQYGQTQGVRGQVQIGDVSIGKGWGFGRPTVDIINFYEENDPRMDASVIFVGDTIAGEVIFGDGGTPDTTFNDAQEIIELETYNQKVFMPGTDQFAQWGYNRKILRYADVLLIAAEAANENGNSAQALTYLNAVRVRAFGDPAAAVTETNPEALRQLIYEERRAELAFEGERFYDLVRTGRAAEVLGPLGFVAGKHELFPVPQSEIDITEGAVKQNPGY